MFALCRIAVGLIFLLSGFEKAIHPYQNFMYVIEGYQLLPGWAEMAVARIFPWIELFTGLFLVLGLWSEYAIRTALVMTAVFICVVGQALLRGLPLEQCGCFGELVHIKPQVIIVLDSFLLLLNMYLALNPRRLKQFSLDQYCAGPAARSK